MTLRARLITWFCGTLAIILVIFSGMLLLLQPQVELGVLDDELRDDVVTATGVLVKETRELGPGRPAVTAVMEALELPDRGLMILDADGLLLGERWNGIARVDGAVALARNASSERTSGLTVGDARIHIEKVTLGQDQYRVLVAASLDQVAHEGEMLRRAIFVAIPIALLLAAMGGWLAATRALRPVSRMAVEASRIDVSDPDARLTIPTPHDEMGTLGRSFNALLDRMSGALAQQRRFMADASHELRTPVSVVRTAADVTLGRPSRMEEEYRESLGIVGDQARRLSRMVDDMFLLARADAGQRRVVASEIYFDDLVDQCVRSVRVLATKRHVTIDQDLASDVSWYGDEALARQLVTNLLDNAVRYSGTGGEVKVALKADTDWIRLSVSNDGPVIPVEQPIANLRALRQDRHHAQRRWRRRARPGDRSLGGRDARRCSGSAGVRARGHHVPGATAAARRAHKLTSRPS